VQTSVPPVIIGWISTLARGPKLAGQLVVGAPDVHLGAQVELHRAVGAGEGA
jgi:hypothetical protein